MKINIKLVLSITLIMIFAVCMICSFYLNEGKCTLKTFVTKKTISNGNYFKIVCILQNNTNQGYYFHKYWYSRSYLWFYDLNHKELKIKSHVMCSRKKLVFDKEDFFLLKPGEKKEYKMDYILGKGKLEFWDCSYTGYYIKDYSYTNNDILDLSDYILIENNKQILYNIRYLLNKPTKNHSKKWGLNIYMDDIISNDEKITI